jgi:hypothetical protein
MAAAVSGLSPVIMTVLMPIRWSSPNRARMPPLDDVLQLDDPDHAGAVGDHERGRALLGDPVDRGAHLGGETNLAARFPTP